MANTNTICHKCKREVDISQVRYIPKGNDEMEIVCMACSGQQSNTQVIASKAPTIETTIPKIIPEKPKKEEKIKYFCGRCKYKFKYLPSSTTKLKCPYCGKDDKIMEDKSDAGTILREVSNPRFDEARLF